MTKEERAGLDIIQKKGINFTAFRKKLGSMFESPKVIDEDWWIDWYKEYGYDVYAWTKKGEPVDDIEVWARERFSDWNLIEHHTQLKQQYKTIL